MHSRTWLEELVAEWLYVNGYGVVVNVLAGAASGVGGRKLMLLV